MSIQYAGGSIINATLTQVAGTRAELAQWVRDQLVAAGWTSAGSATDYQVTCATTAGGALACRVRVYDPGAGNCARLKMSNTSGLKTQTGDLFLLPAVGKVWRIIANKHQFFVFTPGTSVAREFACGGVPYLPMFLQGVITEALWAHSTSSSDTDILSITTAVHASFRNSLSTAAGSAGNQFNLVNASAWEVNFSNTGGIGLQKLLTYWSPTAALTPYRWHDLSLQVIEPLIAWGTTLVTDESLIRGQLWDSVIITDAFAADTTITLDGRTYYAITGGNTGTASSVAPGTLFVAVT